MSSKAAKEIERGFDIKLDVEGSDVGYRWFARTGKKPLYAFGYGLTYTNFAYRDLRLERDPDGHLKARFTVTNTGAESGTDIPQVYLLKQPRRTQQRLTGWGRVTLAPGKSTSVTVDIDQRLLANWDDNTHGWKLDSGRYRLGVGANAADIELTAETSLAEAHLKP